MNLCNSNTYYQKNEYSIELKALLSKCDNFYVLNYNLKSLQQKLDIRYLNNVLNNKDFNTNTFYK